MTALDLRNTRREGRRISPPQWRECVPADSKPYHFSRNANVKTGNAVITFSCVPGIDCVPNAPCLHDCYACRNILRRRGGLKSTVGRNWLKNSSGLRIEPDRVLADLTADLSHKPVELVRLWVAGDFPTQGSIGVFVKLAERFPNVRFLAFTKRHDLEFPTLPPNFVLLQSQWPDWDVPAIANATGNAWLESDDRKPANAFRCPGACGPCGYHCWDMPRGSSVFFHYH